MRGESWAKEIVEKQNINKRRNAFDFMLDWFSTASYRFKSVIGKPLVELVGNRF